MSEPLVAFDALPFHVGVTATPTNGACPDTLPFAVGVVPHLGLLQQVPDRGVQDAVRAAYERGAILGTPVDAGGLGRAYAEDFLQFLRAALPSPAASPIRVLEVGCGNGYLLSRLRELGAEVVGIEPGPHGQDGAARYGVRVIRDTFPPARAVLSERFDVIVNYALLEHVDDPQAFVAAEREHLTPGGLLVFAVPNCLDAIRAGDPSMFLHEHVSYFTPDSFRALMANAGCDCVTLARAGVGDVLYAAARPSASAEASSRACRASEGLARRVGATLQRFSEFLREAADAGRSVGLFCPARGLNLLHLVGPAILPRLFDDDPRLTGAYYPPLDRSVECRQGLLDRPVDELVVLSRAFGPSIRESLLTECRLRHTQIRLFDDVAGGVVPAARLP